MRSDFMKVVPRVGRFILDVLAPTDLIVAAPILALSSLLIVRGETAQARLFGSAAVLSVAIPLVSWASVRLRRKIGFVVVGILGAAALGLLCVCYGLTPDGSSLPGSRVRSHYRGSVSYRRASVANLVPEVDQLKLGTYVFPLLDPFIDRKQAKRIRSLFLDTYHEMDESPEFECLGSVMNYVYRDLLLNSRPSGHFYEYLPQTAQGEKLPVILFLHGSLGNFKGYLWLWKRFADRYGVAVVAPSFGMGDWQRKGGEEVIQEARQYCCDHPRMNGAEIYLVGLSNGGKGISRAAGRTPQAYKGLVFISPIMEDKLLLDDPFLAGWQGRRILILHGAVDRRIPAVYIRGTAQALQKRGIVVYAKYYENEDHFLVFSSWDEISKDMFGWMNQDEERRATG
jgi:pimeloyl-ACP methyl ester carboxylesterase